MTVEPASSARILFLAASKLPDDAARQAFLRDACGDDPTLRQKVERLLAAMSPQAESPLQLAVDRLAGASFAEYLDLDETSPSNAVDNKARTAADNDAMRGWIDIATHPLIGPYKLLEEIGHGGMGAVYMAQQTHPVKRKVALKVIKPGMDTREVIARFEAERQALAVMEHPNIAKVLDGGTTDAGRPYFVMELVRGVPLTEFCQAKKLGLRERLQLFMHVCKAVQHAHQKGIIHRDLKPSNLLVTLHDGIPVVKVIDFGVAKALNQELTERTLFTHFSQMIGTPLYMAPEQAEMSGLDLDTRSDIYSLGVILYELLTGTTPFDRETMSKLGVDGIRKLLKEEDPQRPSVRMSTLRAANQSTINERRVIDTEDVTRQLKRELDWIVMKALEKDRERRYESANAFAADVQRYLDDEPVEACPPSTHYRLRKYTRRHKRLLTTTGLLVTTLLLATGTSVWYAVKAYEARDEADYQKNIALDAKDLADRSLAQSRLDFDRAVQAMDVVVEQLSSPELAQIPGVAKTRSEMLQRMLAQYEEIAKEHGDDPYARQQQALAYGRISDILVTTGQLEGGESALHQGILILEELLILHPDDHDHKEGLAGLLFQRLHLSRRTRMDRLADAERALLIYEELASADNIGSVEMLGLLHLKVAHLLPPDSPKIDLHISESIRIPESHGLTPHWDSYITLAQRAEKRRDWFEAEKNYRRGIELSRPSLEAGHRIDRGLLSINLSAFAKLLHSLGRDDEADRLHLEAIEVARQLRHEYGTIQAYDSMLSDRIGAYAMFLADRGQTDAANEWLSKVQPATAQEYALRANRFQKLNRFTESIADREKAIELEPDNWHRYHALAFMLNYASHARFRDYDRALHLVQRSLELNPENVPSLILLANILYERFLDYDQALIHLDKAAELAPSDHAVYRTRASVLASNGDYVKALADAEHAVQLDPNTWSYYQRALIHASRKEFDLALTDFKLAEVADDKNSYVYDKRADIYISQLRFEDALVDLDKSLRIAPLKSWVYKKRGLVHFQLARFDNALADIAKAVELNPRDFTCLTAITPDLVANCESEAFRAGMAALADHCVDLAEHSAGALSARAQLLFAFGEWEHAREDLDAIRNTKEAACSTLYQATLLSAAGNDMPRYKALCLKMLAAFAESEDVNEVYFIAWACALAPNSLEDYTPAIKLARHAVEKDQDNQQYLNGLGAILMRGGEYAEAKEHLEAALKATESDNTSTSYVRYFLAMTEQHVGNTEAAKKHLQAANRSAERELGESPSWNRKLTLELLRQEAEALINASKVEESANDENN